MAALTAFADPSVAIEVTMDPLPKLSDLEREWRDLEGRSNGSFFVGWSWIGCWLESINGAAAVSVLRAASAGCTVGLGLMARGRERRHLLIHSHTLRLHATGRREFDILCIECNGFLVDRRLGESVSRRMLDHLVASDLGWDELVLDGLSQLPSWPTGGRMGLRRMVRPHANHYVDLAAVRDCGRGYLALLGSKTRYRIRRSCREYEKLGAIRLRRAADATEASTFLDELKALHQAYWTARGQPGAFASRYFDQFHHNLVRGAFGRGEIQLLRIDVADRPIGYVYNFVYRGRVYNYQTGFDYQVCAKGDRPGIVSHVRAIEFNAERGNAIYDFLGGDLEYKRELGTHIAGIYQVILQRDRMRFRVEDAMHTLYRRLRGRREDAARCNRDEAQVRLETEP